VHDNKTKQTSISWSTENAISGDMSSTSILVASACVRCLTKRIEGSSFMSEENNADRRRRTSSATREPTDRPDETKHSKDFQVVKTDVHASPLLDLA
jgi:hypothetical protein